MTMIRVQFGGPGVPASIDHTTRYDYTGAGIVEVQPAPMQAVARNYESAADWLPASYTAKNPNDREELRRMVIGGYVTELNAALTGRRDNADMQIYNGVRLTAVGYVNPHDILAGAHRPDIPLITTDVEMVP